MRKKPGPRALLPPGVVVPDAYLPPSFTTLRARSIEFEAHAGGENAGRDIARLIGALLGATAARAILESEDRRPRRRR